MNTASKALLLVNNPARAIHRVDTILREQFVRLQNLWTDWWRFGHTRSETGLPEFDEVVEHARTRTDISDHLVLMFVESLAIRPSLIVELGVREGESTFVFERVARIFDSHLVSVDLQDCSHVSSYPKRTFIRSDDITFAERFPQWCEEHGVLPSIDVLFIDTSHELEHSLRELESWFPFLSDRCKVFFHDTNIKRVFRRRDGSIGLGWMNSRGVIAAIEKYFGRRFYEDRDFTTVAGDWVIRHLAPCNGMTIFERRRTPVSAEALSVATR